MEQDGAAAGDHRPPEKVFHRDPIYSGRDDHPHSVLLHAPEHARGTPIVTTERGQHHKQVQVPERYGQV